MIEELAALFNAAISIHMLRYLMIAVGTLGRPGAILQLPKDGCYDQRHQIIKLNPPGRTQNRKFRPTLPVPPTLRPWLEQPVGKSGLYIEFQGRPIKTITGAWRILRKQANLPPGVTP